MYVIFKTGGKQYRAQVGQELAVELLPAAEGHKVTFPEVLLVSGQAGVQVGRPHVAGCQVTATVVRHGKGPKIRTFKMRRRKHYRKTIGHRQPYTVIRIEEIPN